ncbi:MAG TPA: phosphopantetheine-binding protein [Micromonosporaceae bacterium]
MTAPNPDRAQLVGLVRAVVGEILPGVPRTEITEDRHPRELGADSVDRVEIVLTLIERLNLDRPMSDFNDLPNLGALVDLIASDVAKGSPA